MYLNKATPPAATPQEAFILSYAVNSDFILRRFSFLRISLCLKRYVSENIIESDVENKITISFVVFDVPSRDF